MKRSLVLAALLASAQWALGQNPDINNRNYYNYYLKPTPGSKLKGKVLSTGWLQAAEVAPLLKDELQKAGHDWAVTNQLYRVDSMQYVVLTAYSQKTGVGIFYTEGHEAFPRPASRQERGRDLGAPRGRVDYVQMVAGPGKQQRYVDIRRFPDTVLLLAEDWYWYQYTDNPADNKHLLTKEDALRILREDVREKLAAMPKR